MSTVLFFKNSIAHDSGYQIGYLVGRFLPFVILAVLAYFLFRYFRKKSKK